MKIILNILLMSQILFLFDYFILLETVRLNAQISYPVRVQATQINDRANNLDIASNSSSNNSNHCKYYF
jgi:hypothetical protein